MFSTHLENFLPLSMNLKLSLANSFSLEEFKIWCLGKGLVPTDIKLMNKKVTRHFSGGFEISVFVGWFVVFRLLF